MSFFTQQKEYSFGTRTEPRLGRIIGAIIAAFLVLIVLLTAWPFTQVSEGERGIVLKFGQAQDKVLPTGLHVVNPFTTDVEKMDVKVQVSEVAASAASKDIQTVTAKVAVTYHLSEKDLLTIYKSVKSDYAARYIAPNIQESVKAATAKYTAEELITKREAVRDDIKNNFIEKINGTGIVVDNIAIVDFDFSAQFNVAVEAKVTAEQKAKEAQNKLVQVEAEAKQKVAQAQAEAESIRLQSQAANNDKFIKLKQLEVQAEFARKWNGVLPVNLYGSAPIPFLNLGGN